MSINRYFQLPKRVKEYGLYGFLLQAIVFAGLIFIVDCCLFCGFAEGVEFVQPQQEESIRACTLIYDSSCGLTLPDIQGKYPVEQAHIMARPDQEIIVFDPQSKKRLKIKFADVVVLRQIITEQKEEKEWRWKEGGSNEKLFTGRSYFWRRFGVELELKDGSKVSGVLAAGFMLKVKTGNADKWVKLVIKPRDKSEMLQKFDTPEEVQKFREYGKYVREILFDVRPQKNSDVSMYSGFCAIAVLLG